jgi:hypothetical protein
MSGWRRDSEKLSFFTKRARSPSGKAKVCKTFIGGSIPPRASKLCQIIQHSAQQDKNGRNSAPLKTKGAAPDEKTPTRKTDK